MANATLTAIVARHRNEQLARGTRSTRWIKKHVGTWLEYVRDKKTSAPIAFMRGEPMYRDVEIKARQHDGIDHAPVEIRPTFYRGDGTTLMAEMPRKPAERIKQYLTIRRHARSYEVQGLSELSNPPFQVLQIERVKPERSKWLQLEKPSASSLVPDFSGDTAIEYAPRERIGSAIATPVGAIQLTLDFVATPRLLFRSNWQWPKVSMDLPLPIPAFTGTQMRLPI